MSVDLWYLYVVKCADDSLYAGITTDPERRLKEHNESSRGAKYTRSRRPVDNLVILGSFTKVGDALRAEKKFKSLSRREKIMHINEA
mgnify:CR=1 FL=1